MPSQKLWTSRVPSTRIIEYHAKLPHMVRRCSSEWTVHTVTAHPRPSARAQQKAVAFKSRH